MFRKGEPSRRSVQLNALRAFKDLRCGGKTTFVRACPLTNRLRAYRARKPESGRAIAKMRVNPQQRQSPGKTA